VADGQVTQKLIDSTGLANWTTTSTWALVHPDGTDLLTAVLPWAGVCTLPLASTWLLPERTSVIDQWYSCESPETLWMPNATGTLAFDRATVLGRFPGALKVSSV
jgi:hypothetical protein